MDLVENIIGIYKNHVLNYGIEILDKLETIKSKLLVKYPIPYLTQFSHVLLQKA
jgi:hypothetical protein